MAGDQDKPVSNLQPRVREVLPKKGLIFHETEPQPVLCKPKLLPLKSFTLQKLEKMQKEATLRAQEQIEETRRQKEELDSEIRQENTEETHQPETISFD